MPTSGHGQISLIIELITRLSPRSVLEIGTGFGKYGVLCREYLGATAQIEGIEGFPDYVGDLHRAVYDTLHLGDARDLVPKLDRKFDLILLIDVFEHLDRDDGVRLLRECFRLSPRVLISVPATWDNQDGGNHNPLQTHRSHYTARDFRSQGFQVWRIADHVVALKAPEHLKLQRVFVKWAASTLAPRLTALAVRIRDRFSPGNHHHSYPSES